MRHPTFGLVALVIAIAIMPLPMQALGPQDAEPARGPAAAAPVNLNTATVAQLEALPGIGVKMAERIIEYRQKQGGFKKVEDLMNVRGIGEKNFLKLKPLITVTPPKIDRSGSL